MSLGIIVRSALLNLLYGNQSYSAPASLYVGLSLTDPGSDGAGITEPSGGAYERLLITNNTTTFPNSVGGQKSIAIDLDWAQATAEWGNIGYAFLITAAVGGTFYGSGAISGTPQYVGAGTRFSIKALQWTISITGAGSTYIKDAFLDHVFGRTTYTPPGNIYMGLSQTDPQSSITEPASGNYQRVLVPNNTTNFPVTSDDTKNNGVAFITVTATGSWGTIPYHFAIDAASGGNLLHSAGLDTTLYPGAGNDVEWAVDDFEVQMT